MLKMFTVYDSKAEAYLQPFYAQATGAGVRIFAQASSDEAHQFNTHAADYTLFEIGTFDEHTGQLEPLKTQLNLGTALQLQDSSKAGQDEPRRGVVGSKQ